MRDAPAIVSHLPVTVVVQVTPLIDHRWLDQRLETIAVLARNDDYEGGTQDTSAQPADGPRTLRYDQLSIDLHVDECESYYFNLMVDEPRCFVVYRNLDGGNLEPFVVTPSYDLAASYEEGDHRVDAVALDPALYPHVEAFVLSHYAPEKKQRRKRRNWSKR